MPETSGGARTGYDLTVDWQICHPQFWSQNGIKSSTWSFHFGILFWGVVKVSWINVVEISGRCKHASSIRALGVTISTLILVNSREVYNEDGWEVAILRLSWPLDRLSTICHHWDIYDQELSHPVSKCKTTQIDIISSSESESKIRCKKVIRGTSDHFLSVIT